MSCKETEEIYCQKSVDRYNETIKFFLSYMPTANNIFNKLLRFFGTKHNRRVITVLGMHRSGTSCLTGLLEDVGVFLGNVSKKNPYNLKGNQENLRIMELNDAVLNDNGATWDNPPISTAVWSPQRKKELKDILKEYDEQDIWAFKDPRVLFTLEGWMQRIPNLQFIGTFRHPEAVAQSLYNRGKMPRDEAYSLWRKYNEKLLWYHEKYNFDVVNFNLESEAYLDTVLNVFKKLGLVESTSTMDFFDSTLRHAKIDEQVEMPAGVQETYDRLLSISI